MICSDYRYFGVNFHQIQETQCNLAFLAVLFSLMDFKTVWKWKPKKKIKSRARKKNTDVLKNATKQQQQMLMFENEVQQQSWS